MSRLTRRSFVKRTGAVTLGSALGLGLVPSVTRKLHAIDTSSSSTLGENWNAQDVVGTPEPYPKGDPKGVMEMSIEVGATVPKNHCCLAMTLTVTRRVQYTEVRAGVSYTGTASVVSHYIWIVENGSPKMTDHGTNTDSKDAAITNGVTSIGTLHSKDTSPGTYEARVFWQPPGKYGPWVKKNCDLVVSGCTMA